jgi:trk system potassium uptake protein TrkA
MFIVINGGGKVGAFLGRTLGEKGHQVALIEKRPEILDKMAEELPPTVARVNNPKNERIFRELGIEGISSTSVISQLIEEEMTAGDILTLHVLEKGRLALVEVLMPDDHGSASNRAIADLALPDKTVLVSVLRGDTVIVPRGNTRLEPGDRVIAITAIETERELRRLLTGM